MPYLKKIQEYINHVALPLCSADISVFYMKFCYSNFCYIKKCRYRFTFNESLDVALIDMVAILMMSTNSATLGLHKIKIFWSKGYDVITYAHDATNKILSRDSNYFVDVVMWPISGTLTFSR